MSQAVGANTLSRENQLRYVCRMIDLDAILVMNQFYVRPPS